MEMTELTKRCNEICIQCIEDCRSAMILSQLIPGMDKCVRQCMLCLKECENLIDNCKGDPDADKIIYEACVEACGNCAVECEQYDYDHCRICAATCRQFQLTYIFRSYRTQELSYQNTPVSVQPSYYR